MVCDHAFYSSVTTNTENGAVDLTGGTWTGDLSYGTFTTERYKKEAHVALPPVSLCPSV